VVTTLVHCIQAMVKTGHVGALLLFDISGFFNNVNPVRVIHLLRNLGFPENICDWTTSFLSRQTASLKIGDHVTNPFTIISGTPQGSPLSPILSALYTSSLLTLAEQWVYTDLSLYVDDGAIYATGPTVDSTTKKALAKFQDTLAWLHHNSLAVDSDKTELMVFTKPRSRSALTGGPLTEARYIDPFTGPQVVWPTKSLHYLGIYCRKCINQ
jgi:hypothetical protein